METSRDEGLSTDPYKGVRDFYPEDMFIQKHMFGIMRSVVESFGYEEYGASILEPTELYHGKTSTEIVNEQTYTFKDRADRDVTLRPEMTPTLARMVAARKRELSFPLRWYSIPNLFRYEKPQRGRLREHYQLNVDMFGDETVNAELEIITLAYTIMKRLGAKDGTFVIKINSTKILNYLFGEVFKLDSKEIPALTRLIDKKEKLDPEDFKTQIKTIAGKNTETLLSLLSSSSVQEFSDTAAEKTSREVLGVKEIQELLSRLAEQDITNVAFDFTLARGFDYYTGIVFEVFDTGSENPRALFGGGRYNDLLSVFGSEKVPAVGFGMGDVTVRDFLETYKLLPPYRPAAELIVCSVNQTSIDHAEIFADTIRKLGLNIATDHTERKIGQKIQAAEKKSVKYIVFVGENEIKDGTYTVKELATGTETVCNSPKEILALIHNT